MKKPEIGERYKPYKRFKGIFIPEALVKVPVKQLSFGAKVAFGRLARYEGKQGEASPKRKTLAKEIGSSERSADGYIKELKDYRLIKVKRRGLQKPNEYHFIWHKIFDEEKCETAIPKSPKKPNQKPQDSVTPIYEERESVKGESIKDISIYHSFAGEKQNKDEFIGEISEGVKINKLIKLFEPVNRVNFKSFYKNKKERNALKELVDACGYDMVVRAISILPITNTQEYMPSITSPSVLLDKWQNLENALKRKTQHQIQEKGKIIIA